MNRALQVLPIVAMLAIAGCLGGGNEPSSDETEPGPDATQVGGNETGGPATGVNAPPVAAVTANVTNGSAPLNVTFTLEGSDEDGDNLTWEFDADGDGDAAHDGNVLPATVNVTFNETGLYLAVLRVSDGTHMVNATAEVNVTAAVSGSNVLYLVGDGSTTIVTDPTSAQADTGQPFVTDKALSASGNGGSKSTFVVAPSGNPTLARNYLLPTFIGSETVTFTGAPVTLTVYVNQLCPPNAAGYDFPLHALIMTSEGEAITTLAAAAGPPGASVSEIAFTLEPEAGTYEGIIIQYGKSATSDPPSPCTAFVTEWGADDVNARLELAAGDVIVPAA